MKTIVSERVPGTDMRVLEMDGDRNKEFHYIFKFVSLFEDWRGLVQKADLYDSIEDAVALLAQ